MSYQVEKISGNQVKINFEVSAETFNEAIQQSYLKTRGRINVPGFRKGKAPRKLIENIYGVSVFYDEAFDQIFPGLYEEVIEKEGLFPVDQPDIKLDEIKAGQELRFNATVYVRPEVTLGNYRGLHAVKYVPSVTQEQIDHRISHDVSKVTTQQDIGDRALEEDDTADIDYLGTVDGEAFKGGQARGKKLRIGSESFISGFEAQLIGMKIGEEKDILVTFPEDYHTEDISGKEAVFHVKINGATSELKPALDDEFAQDISEYQTFEEYRNAIEKELQDSINREADIKLENALVQQAVDASDCDIPSMMIERRIDGLVQNMRTRMMYQGLKYEDYLKYTGTTEDGVRDMLRQDAANEVKTDLVLEAVRKAESIEPTAEEIDFEISEHAREINRDPVEYKASLNDTQKGYYQDIAANKKVLHLFKENAVIEVRQTEEETISADDVLQTADEAISDAVNHEDPDTADTK